MKAPVKFIIYSQTEDFRRIDDPRIEYRIGDFTENCNLYKDADVFLFPRRYAGQSLTLMEAMSCGLAVIGSGMKPQSAFIPEELQLPVIPGNLRIYRVIESGDVNPVDLANKIDSIAFSDITRFSEHSNRISSQFSWTALKTLWEEVLHPGFEV